MSLTTSRLRLLRSLIFSFAFCAIFASLTATSGYAAIVGTAKELALGGDDTQLIVSLQQSIAEFRRCKANNERGCFGAFLDPIPVQSFQNAQIFVETARFGGVESVTYLNGYAPFPDRERFTTRLATVEEIRRHEQLSLFGPGEVTVIELPVFNDSFSSVLPNQPAVEPLEGDHGVYSVQDQTIGASDPDLAKAYDNFTITNPGFTLNEVSWTGIYSEEIPGVFSDVDFLVEIWNDLSGVPDLSSGPVLSKRYLDGNSVGPGADDLLILGNDDISPSTQTTFGGGPGADYTGVLPGSDSEPFSGTTRLTPGDYWISIQADQRFDNPAPVVDPEWQWHLAGEGDGFLMRDRTLDPDGTPEHGVVIEGKDLAFSLGGELNPELQIVEVEILDKASPSFEEFAGNTPIVFDADRLTVIIDNEEVDVTNVISANAVVFGPIVLEPPQVVPGPVDLGSQPVAGGPVAAAGVPSAKAVVSFNLDSRRIDITGTVEDLTSDATSIGLYGPAAVGEVGPAILLFDDPSVAALVTDGSDFNFADYFSADELKLSAEEANWLMSALTYLQINTVNNPNGEVRGQIGRVGFIPEPGGLSLAIIGLLHGIGLVRRRRRRRI